MFLITTLIYNSILLTPIYKTGDPTELTNYRPISLVSEISKVLEKLAKIQLQKFINSKHSIN